MNFDGIIHLNNKHTASEFRNCLIRVFTIANWQCKNESTSLFPYKRDVQCTLIFTRELPWPYHIISKKCKDLYF